MDHANLAFLETLYERYRADPSSVDLSWRHFFEGMDFGVASVARRGASDDLRVYHLIEAYRTYGHLQAQFNPIALHASAEVPELSLERLGFTKEELSAPFPTCGFLKEANAPLKTIVEALQRTYCRTIGIEYRGLGNPALEEWLQKRIEPNFDLQLDAEQKKGILHDLNRAEIFEAFLHTKYVGQKRFSLEGAESLIPLMSMILETGAEEGATDLVLGMAHRGRLNVLANILNKSYAQIFHEFEDHFTPELFEGTGDVKYHKGFQGKFTAKNRGSLLVTLAANPSHLESVDPVVEGEARALQDLKRKKESKREVIPLLVHGDAAIAGQGVVYETMQFGKLNGYGTGGTLHIVINNQIGFTTLPKDSRSTRYCTDIARAFGAPVFHVNAENPEECVAVAKIAMQLRQKFQCDVVIDLNSYRKYGHNEGDEPFFTQPLEYTLIKSKRSIREIYRDQLIREGVLDQAGAEGLEEEFKKGLQQAFDSVKAGAVDHPSSGEKSAPSREVETGVAAEKLKALAATFCRLPATLQAHPKVARLFEDRLKMVEGDASKASIDWGMGEYLAYATLADAGVDIRLSGQDSRRGTFSHRHAVVVDQGKEERYFPLSHLREGQALCDVFNSPLSEYAVLGFEFGYSLLHPKALVIWEAQYGDFCNTAQVIIDQYIASSEQKWSHRSNLTLMLPHGMDGSGPDHSSARLERFLQLCGDDNMQIVNCTTPAQLFHLLRKQALNPLKKPLVLFTPKMQLRHPLFVSSLNDLTRGGFQEVLDDPKAAEKTKRILLCSGKIYYDLLAEREKRQRGDVALLRIEQLYPFPAAALQKIVERYKGFEELFWVQEEHSNMGAWEYIRPLLEEKVSKAVRYAGRGRSASSAVGSHGLHQKQQAALMDEVFR